MPPYFIITVPIIVAVVSGWLCDDDLGDGANSIISMITLVGFAYLWSRVSKVVIADLVTNIVIVAAISAALAGTPLSPLYLVRQWLVTHTTSPLAKLPTITISVRPTPKSPTVQSSSLLALSRQWTARPTPVPPTTWQPSRESSGIHHGDTASIPAVSLPSTPPSQPLTLRPMYPPYPQKGTYS